MTREAANVVQLGSDRVRRLWSVFDRVANLRHRRAFDAAEDTLTRAREDASQRRQRRIVTTSENGFHERFSANLRNSRVPVAAVSPSSGRDWSDQCAPEGYFVCLM